MADLNFQPYMGHLCIADLWFLQVKFTVENGKKQVIKEKVKMNYSKWTCFYHNLKIKYVNFIYLG